MAFIGIVSTIETPTPKAPEISPIITVSALNTWLMFRLDAPRARSMPISFVRSITLICVIMPIMIELTTRLTATKAMST